MKWGRSNEMKESFNCITHPHATSCSKLSHSSAGMDIGMNRKENNAPADDGLLNGSCGFICSSLPLYTATNIPKIHISHTNTHTKGFFFLLHTSNKPGYQKGNQCRLIISNPAKKGKKKRNPVALVGVQMSATHSKTKPSTDTDSCHPLSMAPKNKADSEMPPRDFLEELIYSI